MTNPIRPTLTIFAVLTLITGVLYPLVVTGVAQVVFPFQANGSMIKRSGIVQGSTLIGQQFNGIQYFWGRPSATGPFPYNAAASSGSNLGPANPSLLEIVQIRVDALKITNPGNHLPIPVDLVTASASGLDPNISIAAAYYQIPRIARVRGMSEADVTTLVNKYTEKRQMGFLGEPRVNVLLLNIALDAIK